MTEDKISGALLGLAVGDAIGTTLEFATPGSFEPISDMVGGGPFDLNPGEWTDDTSMALCLGKSLLESGGFDPEDQIQKYCNWYQQGYMSVNGQCFDIGITVTQALRSFLSTGDPYSGSTDSHSSGNGSIMRLAPVAMYYHRQPEKAIWLAGESSRTTHGSKECVESCMLFCSLILAAFGGNEKEDVCTRSGYLPAEQKIANIGRFSFLNKPYHMLRGSGYVVDSLEAALWCFMKGSDFREAVLLAANLGDDADTTAAVCGQIAGAFYGRSGIPEEWLRKLAMREEITDIAEALFREGPKRSHLL